jgi:hypothetical protein
MELLQEAVPPVFAEASRLKRSVAAPVPRKIARDWNWYDLKP